MQLKFTCGWGTQCLFPQTDLYNIDLIRNRYGGILGIDLFVLCRSTLVLWAKNWKILDCRVAEKVDFRQKYLKSYTLIIHPFLYPQYKKDSSSRELNKGPPGLLRAGAFFFCEERMKDLGWFILKKSNLRGFWSPPVLRGWSQALYSGARDKMRQWARAHWDDVQNTPS